MNAISTLTNVGRVRFSVFAGKFTAAVLIGFLTRLLGSTTGAVFLTLDGHPVHRSRRVREWVAERSDRLRLFFLPPYCPELNPTEYLNNAVKETVPRVRRARSRDELAHQLRVYLRVVQRRPRMARRFFEAAPVAYAASPPVASLAPGVISILHAAVIDALALTTPVTMGLVCRALSARRALRFRRGRGCRTGHTPVR